MIVMPITRLGALLQGGQHSTAAISEGHMCSQAGCHKTNKTRSSTHLKDV
jgi:hypothetical protein